MKPAKFEYVAPTTLDAAVAALVAANGEGKGSRRRPKPVAAAQLPDGAARGAGRSERHQGDLSFMELRGDSVAIGALTRHREIEHSPLIASRLPVMSAAMRHVAHLAIRNRGTIGGSLSHADPAAELPMMAMFYGASLTVQGPEGPANDRSAMTSSSMP